MTRDLMTSEARRFLPPFGVLRRIAGICMLVLSVSHGMTLARAAGPFGLTDQDKNDISFELQATPRPNTDAARAEQLVRIVKLSAHDDIRDVQDYTKQGISRMGVTAYDAQELPTGGELPVKNIVVRLDGEDPDAWIVVGAHLDKVSIGDGTIDDWSGCIAVANLFERFQEINDLKHTFIFVFFAYEEDGLWGSRSFVKRLEDEGYLDKVKAMVNLECLGVAHTHIWQNGSTFHLAELAENVAANTSKVSLTNRPLPNVGADSVPFFNAGIPAITFDSLDEPNFGKIHSAQDEYASISKDQEDEPFRMYESFRFAFDYLLAVDALTPSPLPRALIKSSIARLSYESFHPEPATHDDVLADIGEKPGRMFDASAPATDRHGEGVLVVGSGNSAELIIVRDSRVWRIPISSIPAGTVPTRLFQ